MQRRKFSAEFKKEAVQLTNDSEVPIKQIAEELGIGDGLLHKWRRDYLNNSSKAFPGKGTPRDQEMMALKRELSRVKKERDFLKEAAAYFAREPK